MVGRVPDARLQLTAAAVTQAAVQPVVARPARAGENLSEQDGFGGSLLAACSHSHQIYSG